MDNKIYLENRNEWRDWLSANHDSVKEIWLVYYKKHTGKPRVAYNDAVEEALCFGWIDSIVRRIDDDRYMQKFTPRKDKSKWSESNKNRVARLIKNGQMTEIGMAKIRAAKESGEWEKIQPNQEDFEIPSKFANALKEQPVAMQNFDKLAPSHQRQYIGWIASAKLEETRQKRIKEAINLLSKNKKLGMK
ncbi:MAG: YdeI/OmpD-associated family protein [Candidatus Electryonea clarkiae]|nr:YdeI/OmpD-associated family protein [Candidatus Electryonea clarkiae]MDP8287294.1 YdeI/OmpD-associated family protein [Candidatus Electryonea clarkiae]